MIAIAAKSQRENIVRWTWILQRFNEERNPFLVCGKTWLIITFRCVYCEIRLMTKPTKWHVRPAKTQINLGIRPVWSVFAGRMKKAWVLCYPLSAQQRLWSDWADAQADLSLRWAHMPFCWFCHEAAQLILLSMESDIVFPKELEGRAHKKKRVLPCISFFLTLALCVLIFHWFLSCAYKQGRQIITLITPKSYLIAIFSWNN